MLGLSATIGQPEAFSDWLGSVQKEHKRDYSMVEHKHRYSHLRKYIWQFPPPTQMSHPFPGLKSAAANDRYLRVLHPMSALLLGGHSIPPDLALESQDCLGLYSMMAGCVPQDELKHLRPDDFFSGKQSDFLKQSDVIRYEEALKSVVNQWMKAPDSETPDSPYQKFLSALQADMNRGGPIDTLEDAHSDDVAIESFIHLLHKLDSNNDLVS
jgi:hypothetical protein